ncbi:MAG: tetratricopeptide repeat protein [Calditrichia bacterium]
MAKAIDFYQKSLDGKEKVGDIHGMAQTLGNLGNVYKARGEWDKAIDFYQKSHDIPGVSATYGMAITYNNLGNVSSQR